MKMGRYVPSSCIIQPEYCAIAIPPTAPARPPSPTTVLAEPRLASGKNATAASAHSVCAGVFSIASLRHYQHDVYNQAVAIFNQEDQHNQCFRVDRHLPPIFKQAEALHVNLDLTKAVSRGDSNDLSIPLVNPAENIWVP